APVDAVEQRRKDDRSEGQLVTAFDAHADGRETRAQGQEREEIRHHDAHGYALAMKHPPPPPAPRLGFELGNDWVWADRHSVIPTGAPWRVKALVSVAPDAPRAFSFCALRA